MRYWGFNLVIGCRIGLVLASGLLVCGCTTGTTGPAPVGMGTVTESGNPAPARAAPEAVTAAKAKTANGKQHRRHTARAAQSKAEPANRLAQKHPPPSHTSPEVIPLD